ncbi:Saccharopine dehydrogenase [Porites harrisoni]
MAVHLWLRAETKPNERRTHITPERCKDLVQAGFKLTVEKSDQRIFKDEEYASIPGVEMAPLGSWTSAPKGAFIVGLKELPETDDPVTHRHIFYAHAYKDQTGWAELLYRFVRGGGSIYDIEFMCDDTGKCVVPVFSTMAGLCGMAVGIIAWCHQQLNPVVALPSVSAYDNEESMLNFVKSQLQDIAKKRGVAEVFPRILVVGALGRCGKGAIEMLLKMGIPKSNIAEWDIAETRAGGPFPEILQYDIFVNCILLTEKIPPFITKEMLDTDERSLSIVVDISCDASSPNNPLPFYDTCTSFKEPTCRVKLNKSSKPLDVVAIDHFPSLLPRESSTRFADDSTPHLLKLTQVDSYPVWVNAKKMFDLKSAEAEALLKK